MKEIWNNMSWVNRIMALTFLPVVALLAVTFLIGIVRRVTAPDPAVQARALVLESIASASEQGDEAAILAGVQKLWWESRVKDAPRSVTQTPRGHTLLITSYRDNTSFLANAADVRQWDTKTLGVKIWRSFQVLTPHNLRVLDLSFRVRPAQGKEIELLHLRCDRDALVALSDYEEDAFAQEPYSPLPSEDAYEIGVAIVAACETQSDRYDQLTWK